MQQIISAIVRLLGLGVLLFGIGIAIVVIVEAWRLYQAPERIERFAAAIERGSNLDKIFAPRRTGSENAEGTDVGGDSPTEQLRLSYFAAWFIVLLLLFVLAVIAMSAISTGGQLALYDNQVKKLSRTLVKEVRRAQRPS